MFLFGFFGIIMISACSSSEKKTTDTAEALYDRAKELEKDGRIEEAVQKFNEVKNRFPYSKLATEAELAAADVSFNDESYPEAQVAYQMFRDLHPKHPKIPYVLYQIGMSIYHQIPEAIDRDLLISKSAIEVFGELINQFPDYEHIA